MTPVSIRPPTRVVVPATPHDWLPADIWTIVHVGQSAALLGGPRVASALVLTGRERGLAPDGIGLTEPEFARLGLQLAAIVRAANSAGRTATIDLSAWRALHPTSVDRVDLRIRPTRLAAKACADLSGLVRAVPTPDTGHVMDPRPLRRLAGPLTVAALTARAGLVRAHLRHVVGAGPGATPAGDDVLIGVLATLHAAEGTALTAAQARRARQVIEEHLRPMLCSTTAASRHDLDAALRGDVAEHVHGALRALGDHALGPAAVTEARRHGATSGIDLLSGLVGAAQAVLRHGRAALPDTRRHLRRSA